MSRVDGVFTRRHRRDPTRVSVVLGTPSTRCSAQAFVRDLAQNMSNHRQGIKELEDDERRVNRGGAAAKGRYALDRVLDFIAEEEALKERQEKARLEAEALRR